MNPLNNKQSDRNSLNRRQSSPTRADGDKNLSKPVRYIVPGIYMTPYGDRRNGCLKAIS
jgi:hypothetical protein